jgi:hypothetical protein
MDDGNFGALSAPTGTTSLSNYEIVKLVSGGSTGLRTSEHMEEIHELLRNEVEGLRGATTVLVRNGGGGLINERGLAEVQARGAMLAIRQLEEVSLVVGDRTRLNFQAKTKSGEAVVIGNDELLYREPAATSAAGPGVGSTKELERRIGMDNDGLSEITDSELDLGVGMNGIERSHTFVDGAGE